MIWFKKRREQDRKDTDRLEEKLEGAQERMDEAVKELNKKSREVLAAAAEVLVTANTMNLKQAAERKKRE